VDELGALRGLAPQVAAELAHQPLPRRRGVQVDALSDERRAPAVVTSSTALGERSNALAQ
jgi:hypothetical protein